MAQAARKRTTAVAARPALRLVAPVPASRRRTSRATRCREVFTVTCVVFAALTLLGLGRVMLSARAAELSIEANDLRKDIKSERLIGDLLEVDCSALTTPSRIESIAGATMKMTDAKAVSYMRLPETTSEAAIAPTVPDVPQRVSESPVVEPSGLAYVLSSVMDMAAGEAQMMLVGDVGLASAK